jgi:hypothetical protein
MSYLNYFSCVLDIMEWGHLRVELLLPELSLYGGIKPSPEPGDLLVVLHITYHVPELTELIYVFSDSLVVLVTLAQFGLLLHSEIYRKTIVE